MVADDTQSGHVPPVPGGDVPQGGEAPLPQQLQTADFQASGVPVDVPAPHLEGRHVRLRPVTPEDYEALFLMATDPEVTFRWRARGNVPSPSDFAAGLWGDSLVNFVVEPREGGALLGHVSCGGAQFRDGFAHIAMAARPQWFRSGIILEGAALLVDYLFALYPFRKLYMESVAYNFEYLRAGVGTFFEVEAQFRQHVWYHDRYWDQYVLAIFRERWQQARLQLLPLLSPADAEQSTPSATPPGPTAPAPESPGDWLGTSEASPDA